MAPPTIAPPPMAAPVAAETDGAAVPVAAEATSEFRPGFEGGLRLGLGVPVGKAGKGSDGADRNLSDLTAWRAPIWVDVGYRVSQVASYGAYVQFGFGKTGDSCEGSCDWSDIRLGVQGQWRFNPEGSVDPWLGLGLGYEWLSYQTLSFIDVGIDEQPLIEKRTHELIGGPELTLQGGLEFRVEDSLVLGPFVTASLGTYLSDSFKCDSPVDIQDISPCPGGSQVEGSAFHSWIGLGIAGRYSP